MANKFIKGDKVIILTGKNKGKVSKILCVKPLQKKVIVQGLNYVKKAIKDTNMKVGNKGFSKRESYIHISNISHIDSKGNASKVGFKTLNGKKFRFIKKNI